MSRALVHWFVLSLSLSAALHAQTNEPCVPPFQDLISWWEGEGHGQDALFINNGRLLNGVRFTNGVIGKAFSFDGIDDRISILDRPTLQLTNSLTIEGWINVKGLPPSGWIAMVVFRGDDRSGLDPYYVAVEPYQAMTFHIQAANNQYIQIHSPVRMNEFFHFAATLDNNSGNMKLYTNGAVASQTITGLRPFGPLQSSSSPAIAIGNVTAGGFNMPFHGLLDEVRIYSRALSEREIRFIAQTRDARFCRPLPRIQLFPGLTLDGAAGTTVRIEYVDALTDFQWSFLTNVTLPHAPYIWIDQTASRALQRYYRFGAAP